jgi:quercetin dioxygenase-like cupin family protein
MAKDYVADPGSDRAAVGRGRFLDLARDVDAVILVPGLVHRPALGESTMLASVEFAPHSVSPLHAHEEEQITVVVKGEVDFEIDGEIRSLGPGMVALVPANVPHGARTGESSCLAYDVFHPPRQALLAAARKASPGAPT